MDILEKFGTDKDLESGDGVELDFGGGAIVRIRRAGGSNREYQAAMRKGLSAHQDAIDNDTLDPDVLRRVYARVYADTIVVDWSGIEVRGKPLRFTPDVAADIFFEVPEFFGAIRAKAESFHTFKLSLLEKEVGN